MRSDRNSINPFTGKKHFNIVNEDKILDNSYNEYNNLINRCELLDETPDGQVVSEVSLKLIDAVEKHLLEIGRSDYTKNYYDWEFHLVANDAVNATCMPGGKIMVYSGILPVTGDEESLAFILGHEMAHALLDHSRTKASVSTAKNTAATAARLGSIGLNLLGHGDIADVVMGTTNVADIGSEYLLIKPWGRNHELEADKLGMMIIDWAGYDINKIPVFWERMSEAGSNNFDFFSTHPADNKRIDAMNKLIQEIPNQKDFTNAPVMSKKSEPKKDSNKMPSFLEIFNQENHSNTPALALGLKQKTVKNENNDADCPLDKFCSKCGVELNENDIFCSKCGNKLSGETSEINHPNMPLEKLNIDEELKEKEIRRLVKAHSKTFIMATKLEPAVGLLSDDEILKYAPKSIAAAKIQAKREGKTQNEFIIGIKKGFGLK